mmetsp:Transcript_39971/g.89738  ORF Transcript_39971/g.89738 Transcript_39971/m.89738 type:complete len:835 (+) Transcript_39971:1055-3559(+)
MIAQAMFDWSPPFGEYVKLLILYVWLHVIRGVMVLCLSPALRRLGYGFDWKKGTILVWGGLRGAVALLLADFLQQECAARKRRPICPPETPICDCLNHTEPVMFYVAGITMLTLVVNAPLTKPLVSMLGLKEQKNHGHLSANLERLASENHTETHAKVRALQKQEFWQGADWPLVWSYLPVSTSWVHKARLRVVGQDVHRFPRIIKSQWRQYGSEFGDQLEPSAGFPNLERHKRMSIKVTSGSQAPDGLTPQDALLTMMDQSVYDEEEVQQGALAELREHYCRRVIAQYNHAFGAGLLGTYALPDLLEAEHHSMGNSGEELAQWQFMEAQGFVSWPKWILRLIKLPLVGSVARAELVQITETVLDMAFNFVEAHRKALDGLGGEVQHGRSAAAQSNEHAGSMLEPIRVDEATADLLQLIEDEVEDQIQLAEDFRRTVQATVPEISASAKTQMAARYLLHSESLSIRELHERGDLSEANYEDLKHRHLVSTQLLNRSPPEVWDPDVYELLVAIGQTNLRLARLLAYLDDEDRALLRGELQGFFYRDSQRIADQGVHIVLRGAVQLTSYHETPKELQQRRKTRGTLHGRAILGPPDVPPFRRTASSPDSPTSSMEMTAPRRFSAVGEPSGNSPPNTAPRKTRFAVSIDEDEVASPPSPVMKRRSADPLPELLTLGVGSILARGHSLLEDKAEGTMAVRPAGPLAYCATLPQWWLKSKMKASPDGFAVELAKAAALLEGQRTIAAWAGIDLPEIERRIDSGTVVLSPSLVSAGGQESQQMELTDCTHVLLLCGEFCLPRRADTTATTLTGPTLVPILKRHLPMTVTFKRHVALILNY